MDVIQLFIEFESKDETDIIKSIAKKFKTNNTNYLTKSKENWKELNNKIQSLYPETGLLAFQNTKKINYYIFNTNSVTSKDKVSLDILILSENENITYSINQVIQNLKHIMKKIKISVIKKNHIYLFPYDNSQRDIYDSSQKIKAEFQSIYPSIYEIIRMIIFLVISIISIILAIWGNFSILEKTYPIIDILWSIGISTSIFLISEIIIKIIPLWSLNVSITNLSDCIKHNHTAPYGTNEEVDNITNPEVEE